MAEIVFDKVSKRYDGGRAVIEGMDLTVADGELLVLVGPSGCGKSTAMRMVAGLEAISSGEIRIGGRVVNDLPPGRRNVAMVFQNYALYPHMTVRRNLEFPLRMRKLPRREITRRVEETARMLDLLPLLERRPKALSGGQRQRVAMGRALVRDADVFLMDEPLSNLDARLRLQIRSEIAALQRRLGVTTLYVTHDQVEAMTLGQRVAVMRDGGLQQLAPPHELYARPANVFVAGFIGSPGMNVMRGTLSADGATLRLGEATLAVPEAEAEAGAAGSLGAWRGRELLVGVRPERLALVGAGDDAIPVVVEAVEALGHETIVHGRGEVATVSTDADPTTDRGSAPALAVVLAGHQTVAVGDRVGLRPDPAGLHFFAPDGAALDGPL